MAYSLLLFVLITQSLAYGKESVMDHDHFTLAINKKLHGEIDSTTVNFGINLPKKEAINYIPYIGAFLRNTRLPLSMVDSSIKKSNIKINSAMVGFEVGIIFPTTINDYRFFIITSIASGQSTVQEDPWWGTNDESISEKTLFEGELGIRFSFDKFLMGYSYSLSNINYLYHNHLLSLGIAF